MSHWKKLAPASDGTHHVDSDGNRAYEERFDEVLKFHAPGLAPVQLGSEAWHINPDGTAAYSHRFKRTFGFYEGVAAVISEEGWLHILPSGKAAYPQRYDWCGNFQGKRCAVRESGGGYRHIEPSGKAAYADLWRYAGDFRDGVAVIQSEDGRSTHIDCDGKRLHNRWFLDLDVFHKGFARARDDNGWTHVDRAGEPCYNRRFAAVEPFYNGQARVERFDGGLEIIDETGRMLAELRPAIRSEFAALSGDMVGFWRTQTIAAAAELGIFETLPATEDKVAQTCGLLPERTLRLLRGLGELSLVTQDGLIWKSTSRGEYLQANHPLTLKDAALEYGHSFSSMWKALPAALQEGGQWKQPDIFGEVAGDPQRLKTHHRMLRSYARHDFTLIPSALKLNGTERVVDAGGGLGSLAQGLLKAYPTLQVTVLDLPEVIEYARAQCEDAERLAWCPMDFFKPWNVQADVVLLTRILHDWNDQSAIQILRRARETLPTDGRIFIVEMLLSAESMSGSLCDLHLLMATGGQERTEEEYRGLLEAAGFALSEVRQLPALPSILVGVAQ
jgi:hypothetical protein